MNNTLKRAIFALLLLCIQQAQSLQCFGCMSNVSFADCSDKAVKLDCNKMDPELVNVTFACAKGSGVGPHGKVFLKTCVPDMTEAIFCGQLSEEAVGGKVDVCKVCKDKDLCNAGSGLVLTGALLLLTVGLMLGV